MPLEPAKTVFPDAEEVLTQFSQTVTYNDVTAGTETTPGTSTPVTISSVTASKTDSGITISFSGNSVTISGKYQEAFTNKSFDYIPFEKAPTVVAKVGFKDIPPKIDTLVGYTPDKTISILITYTVVTSAGSATIEHTVTNNWSAGKDQMAIAQARGVY